MSKKLNSEEFIRKAIEVHGNKYIYNKVEYVNNRTKVIIICPTHGDFYQQPDSHLQKRGCPKCKGDKNKERCSLGKTGFIEKAKLIHGDDTYNYDSVIYNNNKTKVIIECKIHGSFYQTPDSHLSGSGCNKCGDERSGTLRSMSYDYFITKSREAHGDKYDYSKVVIDSSNRNVTIVCPIHGEFTQNYITHSAGAGCWECKSDKARSTLSEFIKKANKVHGSKYCYEKSVYLGSPKKLTITCPTHGDFDQKANAHLSGHGCPICKAESTSAALLMTTETFIKRAREIHGDTYLYDKVVYKGSNKYVTITCREHGDFHILANTHLQGHNCERCSNIKKGLGYRSSTEEFIEKANKVHGVGKYGYDKVVYSIADKKVKIKCHSHGYFYQVANSHLRGNGCPKCNSSRGEMFIRSVLKKEGIKYKEQYMFPLNRYRYDFYIPDYNLLIEFHGEQHYKFVNIFHRSVSFFEKRKDDDIKKIALANLKKIPLIVFNYKHLEVNSKIFEDKLIEILNKIKNRPNKNHWFYHEYNEFFN